MPRKNSNARLRTDNRKIKVQPNFVIQVQIPDKPWRKRDDIRPGLVVAEGMVRMGVIY